MLALAVQELGITSYRLDLRADQSLRSDTLLDSALTLAFLGITDARPQQRWRVDGTARTIYFDKRMIRIKVQDQLGLIDLNAADGTLIRHLLDANLPAKEAEKLTDKILDWRERDGRKRLFGAQSADYAAKGFSYRPRNGPFQSVQELRLVMDMTPAIFAKLAPSLTVYSDRPTIDDTIAAEGVLRAYYRGSSAQLEDALRRQDITKGYPISVESTVGHSYKVDISFDESRRTISRSAVIMITGDSLHPYEIMDWN